MVTDTNVGFRWANETNRVGAVFRKALCDRVIYRLGSEWREVEGLYYADRASRIHSPIVPPFIGKKQDKVDVAVEHIASVVAGVMGKESPFVFKTQGI